jgi:hypothetical protein
MTLAGNRNVRSALLDPPVSGNAPSESILMEYDNYLNGQPVSICAERPKLADLAANSAIVGDETDFATSISGGFDGQGA